MKTRFFDETGRWYLKIIALLALLLVILRMTGCGDKIGATASDYAAVVRKVEFEGHDYLLFRFRSINGTAALHSESCPCRAKAEKE